MAKTHAHKIVHTHTHLFLVEGAGGQRPWGSGGGRGSGVCVGPIPIMVPKVSRKIKKHFLTTRDVMH